MNTPESPAILGGPKTIERPGPHFMWPPITDETRQAVLTQLDRTISIYDKSDVFERFEGTFARYHGRTHSLLHNSGTSAILGMYTGIDLKPGDEVICPTYTFYASVTPMLFTGARPVFCDCREDGNIDPNQIEAAITDKTRAISVTHMWGIPCDMERIAALARKHNLRLLEDCSHAHGAEIDGRKVGTFGDAAAWSLQGQKTVTGGEGGILLTDDKDIHTRALLLGHYNKRCKQEIDRDHPLYEYFLTGFGLKLRAHPIAIAIAEQQFGHLEEWLRQRGEFAEYMIDELKKFDCLSMPNTERRRPSWYAFVMQYHAERAHGLPINEFYKALLAEGLTEADRPGSTRPIHDLPLFTHPERAFPQIYPEQPAATGERSYPQATAFADRAIKFPVWHEKADWPTVEAYVVGIKKILNNTRKLASVFLPKSPVEVSPHLPSLIERLETQAVADGIEKRVVGSVVAAHDKILVMTRSLEDDFLPGNAEIPGGGVDGEETLLEALRRENIEETGVDIARVVDFINSFDYLSGSGKKTRQFNFLVEPVSERVECDPAEHSACVWVSPQDDVTLDGLPMSTEMRDTIRQVKLPPKA